jgi:long-subunit acyl-CoA synthetase (AMP-forming)
MQKKMSKFYELLEGAAAEYKEGTAVLYDTYSVTYERLFRDVVNKALHLQRFEGSRIALYGPASYRWIVNFFGIVLAGKDVVLLDFFLPHEERVSLLKKVNVDYILSSTNQYILADENAIIIPGAQKDDVEGLVYDASGQEGNVIMFTATGNESDKAVVLSGKNLLNTVYAMSGRCVCTDEDRVLAQVSLHHIFGLVYSFLWPLYNGACVCVGRGLRHIDADTHYYKSTILPATPSMLEYLKRINALNGELRTIIVGGASCPYRLFESLLDRDYNVYAVYGMTECSGGIGINRDPDGSYELFEGTQVEFAKNGEILVKGDCVMTGYDNDEAVNAKVFENGVFHTGDYGRMNRHNRLVLSKRNPDILLLPTGEKICRGVVNEEITALSAVAESYLTVCEDRLTAVIVPLDKEMTTDRMKRRIDRFNEKKGYRWEIQKIILLKQPLPKNSQGAVDAEAVAEILEQPAVSI